MLKDRIRDEALRVAGYRVLRFWNFEVLRNKNGVLQVIADTLTGDAR
jgi:very-short-patch-repair endonuclease